MVPSPRDNATMIRVQAVHRDLRILRVRPDGPLPAARPGQHMSLGVRVDDRWERRAFSLSSPILDEDGRGLRRPEAADFFEFYVSREDATFGRRLFALKADDRLWMSPRPRGDYSLDPVADGNDVIFCATGTGEAPHNFMIEELLRRDHAGRIASVVCCRYRRDLAYRQVHERLAALFPHYTYVSMTTREVVSRKRYIQDVLESGELERRTGVRLDPARTHVFLCGDPGMVGRPRERNGRTLYPRERGVIELLETRFGFIADRGTRSGNIHYERYG